MQAIDRIFENINQGYQYGRYVHNVRYPYFHACLSVSENGEFIRWTHFGSSANKNTKQDLQWIIEAIFHMTPGQFEQKHLLKYIGGITK